MDTGMDTIARIDLSLYAEAVMGLHRALQEHADACASSNPHLRALAPGWETSAYEWTRLTVRVALRILQGYPNAR